MQKKIIALAVAGLMSGAAFAQSNVTIYGVVDATFENVKASSATGSNALDFASRNRVQANSNYIGFKGVEDLGNGIKAVWQFENGLNVDGTAGVWNNRDSMVGLTGSYGTAVMGNISGPTRVIGGKMDVNAGATGIGANTALLGKLGGRIGNAGASPFDQRITNAIAYISPTVSGFHGAIGYSAGNVAASGLASRESSAVNGVDGLNGNTAWTLGLIYDQGPIYAGYAYTVVDATNSGAVAADGLLPGVSKATNNRLAGSYNFGIVQVGLMWDHTNATVHAGSDLAQNVWYLSGKFFVTPNGTIIGQYGHAGDVSGNGNLSEGSKHWMLGYEHALSKRTMLKTGYSRINNDRNANNDFLYGVSNASTTAGATALMSDGTTVSGWYAGIRHSF